MKAIFSRVRHPSHPGRGHGSLTCHMTQFERSDWLRSENFTNIMIEFPIHGYCLIIFWSSFGENCYFGKYSLKVWDVFFSRSNTILAISQECLVQLMWNEKEVHRFDIGHNLWPWPLASLMTLTLHVSRSNFEIAVSQELLVWLMWNEKEVSWYDTGLTVWHCPLTTPMTLTLEFLDLGVWRSESEIAIYQEFGGRLTWNEKDVSHPFMILTNVTMVGWADVPRVNGVTSDVGVPSTYLVLFRMVGNGGYYIQLWRIMWLSIYGNPTKLAENRRLPNLPATAFTDDIGPGTFS